jgi:hypothetical protein
MPVPFEGDRLINPDSLFSARRSRCYVCPTSLVHTGSARFLRRLAETEERDSMPTGGIGRSRPWSRDAIAAFLHRLELTEVSPFGHSDFLNRLAVGVSLTMKHRHEYAPPLKGVGTARPQRIRQHSFVLTPSIRRIYSSRIISCKLFNRAHAARLLQRSFCLNPLRRSSA